MAFLLVELGRRS